MKVIIGLLLALSAVLSGCATQQGYWEPIPDPVNGKVYPCCWYPHGYYRFVEGVKPDILPQTKGIKVINKPEGTVPTIHDFYMEPQEQGIPIDRNTGKLAPTPNPLWGWMLPAVVSGPRVQR